MRIDICLSARSMRSRDVAVCAPSDATVADIAPALRALTHTAADAQVWIDGIAADPTGTLDAGILRTGATVHVGPGPARPPARASMLSLRVTGGSDAGLSCDLPAGTFTVGRAPGCNLVLSDPKVSRRHMRVTVGHGVVHIEDLGTPNGTRIDGKGVPPTGRRLLERSVVRVGDTFLSLAGPPDPPARSRTTGAGIAISRTPRPRVTPEVPNYVLPVPEERRRRLGTTLAPTAVTLVTGVSFAVVMHTMQLLLLTVVTPLALTAVALGEHWTRRRRARARANTRLEQQREVVARCAQWHRREAADRRRAHPDIGTVVETGLRHGQRTWERQPDDDDLLAIRVGTGDLPSPVRLSRGDSVSVGTLSSVPVLVDLGDGPLRFDGPVEITRRLVTAALCQLAVWCSPTDVEIIAVLCTSAEDHWAWLRWLPHVRRPPATSPADRDTLASYLQGERDRRGAAAARGDRRIILVVDVASTQTARVAELLTQVDSGCGMTAMVIGDAAGVVTMTRVECTGDTGRHLRIRRGDVDIGCVADLMPAGAWNDVARALAALRDDSPGDDGIPVACSVNDLTELPWPPSARNIAAAWAVSDGRPTATFGLAAAGRFEIDLTRDGPHALIAGTTGSGKSELLRALIVGLALRHPPESLSFVLVDYKGGAAFASCTGLPHVAGLVTDLAPVLTARALHAFDVELRRREKLFAARAAADIDGYNASRGTDRIARLVVVVDEFAVLADSSDEVLSGLLDIARRGRSLGIHLVLATQRPSGVVSAEIRANAALRIALRVNDAHESIDILGSADAAAIDAARPGRAIVSACGLATVVQVAQVSARSADTRAVELIPLAPWRRLPPRADRDDGRDDLTILVAAIERAAESTARPRAPAPWLPPLPTVLRRRDLPPPPRPEVVHLGIVDRPETRSQPPFSIDVGRGGTYLVVGAAASGRTTISRSLIAAAVRQLGAERLQITTWGLDTTGHEGLTRLATALERWTSVNRDQIVPRCHELVVIDGWEEFTAASDRDDHGRSVEVVLELARRAASDRTTVVITGDRGALTARLTGAATSVAVLRLAQHSDYGLAGIDARRVPLTMPVGRAVLHPDAAQVQFALPVDGDQPMCG